MQRIQIITGFLLLFILSGRIASALNTKDLVAYPVPFNPKKGTVQYITIGNDPNKAPLSIDKFKIEVYDINGDKVCTRHYNSATAIWNGRNDNGVLVKPGMYIIKATVENTATGEFGRKIIRILINY